MFHFKSLLPLLILILIIRRCTSLNSFQNSEPIKALINRLDSQRSSATVQENAVKGILQRLLPSHSSSFTFKIISKEVCGGDSCFQIENYKQSSKNGPQIVIKGTTAVELASGLHWYLKYSCGAHISWDKTGGIQIASIPEPDSLPFVRDEGLVFKRPVPWNYYQNVVTSSFVNGRALGMAEGKEAHNRKRREMRSELNFLVSKFSIVESSPISHLNGGEFDHLVAYSLACTLESDVVSARRYESLRFGSFDHRMIIGDDVEWLNEAKRRGAVVLEASSSYRAEKTHSSKKARSLE